ncbi:hypothetical protein JGU66_16800 [Myxococcaceae bacterium JPH2]|nr:hypothetical protein [Myxococcaceae bacterium JPH2]
MSSLALGLCLLLGASAARAAPTPLEDNRRITRGYIELAYEVGAVLDPTLQPGGSSAVRPNWYTFAPHASQTGGMGMYSTAVATKLINALRGRPILTVLEALGRVDLDDVLKASAEQRAAEFLTAGLPLDVSTIFAVLTSSLNAKALLDPRTLATTTGRFVSLYWTAPGILPLDKAEAVVRTLERALHEGNLAIYSDIGGAGRAYLDWRAGAGVVTPGRVLTEFVLPEAVPAEARVAYDFALAHANDTPRPNQFDALFPGMHWKSLLVAAFAVYEESRLASSPARRDALIAMGNNYVAWREQHDMAQPVFNPSGAPDEVSRPALLQALTPLLQTDFGKVHWTYADYANTQPDRDGNPFTSKPTEYNWAVFLDRWHGILYAFDLTYSRPRDAWVMPTPLEDPLTPFNGT